MLGRKERDQLELFMTGSLRQLVPDDHILARVDRVLDLSWLRSEVAELYCERNGRPGIDPEVAVRLMLAGFLLGIVHDRRLMREAHVNLAIRWFIGYGLHEALPDHSSLTRIRQRWGAECFRRIFERTVQACMAAKVAKGEIVHVDASLIRADVSWESLAVRHVDAVADANEDGAAAERDSRKTGKHKKVCVTDPDASMATNGRNRRLSRPTSSMRWSTTSSVWSSMSRSRPARSTKGRSCSNASTSPPRQPVSQFKPSRPMPATPTPRSTAAWSSARSRRSFRPRPNLSAARCRSAAFATMPATTSSSAYAARS